VTPGARGAELVMREVAAEVPADWRHPDYDAFVEDGP
jgi:hypothetical protein